MPTTITVAYLREKGVEQTAQITDDAARIAAAARDDGTLANSGYLIPHASGSQIHASICRLAARLDDLRRSSADPFVQTSAAAALDATMACARIIANHTVDGSPIEAMESTS